MPVKLRRGAKRFKLTRRECETFSHLATGQPWKATAERMGICLSTLKFHVRNLCRKTKAANTIAAFRILIS